MRMNGLKKMRARDVSCIRASLIVSVPPTRERETCERMANDGPGEWYASLPPVSKFWFASCALSTIGFHLNFVDPRSMALSWTRVRAGGTGRFAGPRDDKYRNFVPRV